MNESMMTMMSMNDSNDSWPIDELGRVLGRVWVWWVAGQQTKVKSAKRTMTKAGEATSVCITPTGVSVCCPDLSVFGWYICTARTTVALVEANRPIPL